MRQIEERGGRGGIEERDASEEGAGWRFLGSESTKAGELHKEGRRRDVGSGGPRVEYRDSFTETKDLPRPPSTPSLEELPCCVVA